VMSPERPLLPAVSLLPRKCPILATISVPSHAFLVDCRGF
jgi:hypothetical protein